MPYFNPGTWQPTPFNPGGENPYFNPLPPPRPPYSAQEPYAYLPQPTPGVEPGPYVPDNPADVIPAFGGAPIAGPVGGGGGPSPFAFAGNLVGRRYLPSLVSDRSGIMDRLFGFGAELGGALSGVPYGNIIAGLLYDRLFNSGRAERDPLELVELWGTNYDEMGSARNPMQARRREGSTRFSTGEMDLSNLPMYGAPGSLMPAVFAGQQYSALPGSDRPPYEQAR